MENINQERIKNIGDILPESMEKYIKNAPVGNDCPLADKTLRPKWECGKFDRGNELRCKSVSGYSRCPHYIKWFYWNLLRMIAKEAAKAEILQKKKKQKEK